jgi:hypothetical protein
MRTCHIIGRPEKNVVSRKLTPRYPIYPVREAIFVISLIAWSNMSVWNFKKSAHKNSHAATTIYKPGFEPLRMTKKTPRRPPLNPPFLGDAVACMPISLCAFLGVGHVFGAEPRGTSWTARNGRHRPFLGQATHLWCQTGSARDCLAVVAGASVNIFVASAVDFRVIRQCYLCIHARSIWGSW